MSAKPALHHGLVVGTFGRQYLVELPGSEILTCFPRGKRSTLACGDRVEIARTAPGQGVVEAVDPRSALLYRSDQFRQKIIAANVTQIVIVLAVVPSFYEELLNRCIAAAENQRLSLVIVLNKFDLAGESAVAMDRLTLYSNLGYRVVPLSAKRDISPLRPLLNGHVSVLIGQSGMGKSTIINALIPGTGATTAEISAALDSGRHTTTHARLYHLDAGSDLIDSPGMQEFGLHHLTQQDIAGAFLEIRPLLGHCRFHNCRHLVEPGCAILQAQAEGRIDTRRLEAYRKLVREIDSGRKF
ncbi:MAG TPA: ribosome small subunit-dependent GTPase A [Burkholderiales bacterium]|nr:ribosome small subunit-dependent GTPase A [Burkholderiales bacterium]